ncbi:Lipoamide acyltransferase component of branched-chain alpha-keto acid dehydrogenase complex mitochondrial [Zea mays]|uniref:Dihydrolipoamide acetyltransferase component of pyruvate dehydrogenase complex n=1 Tax=Zea mays TaxID=4577 RepID=A0A1D6MS22_MAIZE|nr:Lipoamide acyltransferase component of branched-chain alpha-keto acid dehydrogenase complex mitochondrial [Zea mays]
MAWARLASRSRLRPAASAAGRSRHASTPAPPPPPSPPTTRTVPAATSAPPLRRLLLLPRHRFADATPSASTAWLLGARWRQGHGRRCFASAAYPAQATPGEASELVDVPLAQTGEGIAECELLRWFVAEGDQVDEFQPLCEVQSDKATIEITSRFKGKVHKIHFVPGDIVKVGETLLKMVVGDSQIVSPDNIVPSAGKSLGVESAVFSSEGNVPGGNLSTPAVRHLAKQYGISINEIVGTGKDGRVLKEDVLNYAVSKGVCKQQSLCDFKLIFPFCRGYQRSMVKSMSLAAKVPHFHYLEEINCDSLVQLKTTFQNENKDQTIKHTFLPFLIKSLSMALSKYPMLNSSFIEETNEVVFKGPHNIGVAMATTHGLVVPNIKKVQSLSILEITKELARLHEMASQNRLSAADIEGGTITLSNIGAIGGKFGSPLLNLPEVAIIALGRIQKLPRFDDDENVYPSSIINVTVGADHRVVDGATVARFCNEWKSLVEKPELLLLHMR